MSNKTIERMHGVDEPEIDFVADEAHLLKSGKSNRAQRSRRLREMGGRVWLVTGTPMDSEPQHKGKTSG